MSKKRKEKKSFSSFILLYSDYFWPILLCLPLSLSVFVCVCILHTSFQFKYNQPKSKIKKKPKLSFPNKLSNLEQQQYIFFSIPSIIISLNINACAIRIQIRTFYTNRHLMIVDVVVVFEKKLKIFPNYKPKPFEPKIIIIIILKCHHFT